MAADSHKELQKNVTFGNWVRKDIQYSQFQNYELTYAHFVRFLTPFSWGTWQPGSSPRIRQTIYIIFKRFWRDANSDYLYSSESQGNKILSFKVFNSSTTLNISSSHGVETHIVHEQGTHHSSIINLHYRFPLFALYCTLQKCWSLHFKLFPPYNILAIHNDFMERKAKEIGAHQRLKRIRIFKNEICNNRTNHLNHYQLKDLLYLYTQIFIGNNLLKYLFFILQQMRDKLIISCCWWRDKISW